MLETGGLVAVLGQRAGNVAHGIRLAGDHRLDGVLERGMPARIGRDHVIFDGGRITVQLSGARTWLPQLRLGIGHWNDRSLGAALQVRDLLDHPAPRFCSAFHAATLRMPYPLTPLTARVSQILPQLALAARAHDRRDTLGLLARLIGLGPGLTPAGDDFIIGWLAGLTLSARSPSQIAFLRSICGGIDGLRQATTSVSCQHLGDACALMFSEHLSALCVAIAVAAPRPTLVERVSAQVAVGASSGLDAAAGLLFALLDCAPAPRSK